MSAAFLPTKEKSAHVVSMRYGEIPNFGGTGPPGNATACPTARARLSARHGRKKCDFTGVFNHGIGPHVAVIDGGADHVRIFESVGVFFAARSEPRQLTVCMPDGVSITSSGLPIRSRTQAK
jgi:hypothetical protein